MEVSAVGDNPHFQGETALVLMRQQLLEGKVPHFLEAAEEDSNFHSDGMNNRWTDNSPIKIWIWISLQVIIFFTYVFELMSVLLYIYFCFWFWSKSLTYLQYSYTLFTINLKIRRDTVMALKSWETYRFLKTNKNWSLFLPALKRNISHSFCRRLHSRRSLYIVKLDAMLDPWIKPWHTDAIIDESGWVKNVSNIAMNTVTTGEVGELKSEIRKGKIKKIHENVK